MDAPGRTRTFVGRQAGGNHGFPLPTLLKHPIWCHFNVASGIQQAAPGIRRSEGSLVRPRSGALSRGKEFLYRRPDSCGHLLVIG